jgi:hypothetical protein
VGSSSAVRLRGPSAMAISVVSIERSGFPLVQWFFFGGYRRWFDNGEVKIC